jgi:predicted small lipoprotein YifL
MTRRILLLGLLAGVLAACGRKGPLRQPTEDDDEEARNY